MRRDIRRRLRTADPSPEEVVLGGSTVPAPSPARPGRGKSPSPPRQWCRRTGTLGVYALCNSERHSLGLTLREISRALWRAGIDVSVRMDSHIPGSWAETSVRHLVGKPRAPYLQLAWGSKAEEPFTPTVDFDVADGWGWSLPERRKIIDEQVDLLCVPAATNIPEFVEHGGVTKPIVVVPLGVDSNLFRPCARDNALLQRVIWFGEKPNAKTKLFLLAGFLQPRKGVDVALEAFQQAFCPQDNVALIVKTVSGAWSTPQGDKVKALGAKGVRLGYLDTPLTDCQFARLLGSCDFVINCHHREGFGYIPLQAMACDTPSIITDFDGPTVYATKCNSFLVKPARVGNAPSYLHNIPQVARWAYLEPAAVAAAMRRAVRATKRDLAEMAEAGRTTVSAYSWDHTAEVLIDAIEQNVGRLRRRVVQHRNVEKQGLTVAFPCRNSARDAQRLLHSLEQTRWAGAVMALILDDSSNDPQGLIRAAADTRVRTRIIRSNPWIGEGAARDWLMEEARGEWVFITDADAEFTDPLWALRLREAHPDDLTIQHPLILYPDGKINDAGGCYHPYAAPLGWLPAWHRLSSDKPTVGLESCVVPYAPTVGWWGRAAAIQERWQYLGGYFPTIFFDVDMAFWMRAHGMRFLFNPVTHITHHQGSYTANQTAIEAQAERFNAHAREFRSWWEEQIEDDLARGLGVPEKT